MKNSRLTTVLLAAVLLVGAANLGAFAATGSPLLLGKSNNATKTTTVKSAKGSALSLKTKKKAPPLKVNSDGLVKKLNADEVDGLDATALTNRVYTYPLPAISNANNYALTFTGLPAGRYLASYSVYGTPSANDTDLSCSLAPVTNGGGPIVATDAGSVIDFIEDRIAVSGSGLVDTTSTDYYFSCFVPAGSVAVSASSTGSRPVVTFVRVDDVVAGTTTPYN